MGGFRLGAVLLAAAIAAGGCAVTVERVNTVSNRRSEEVSDKSYKLGTPQSAVVGGQLVRVRNYAINRQDVSFMKTDKAFTLAGGDVTLSFGDGEELAIVGVHRDREATYTVVRKGIYGVQVRSDGTIVPSLLNYETYEPVEMVFRFTATPPNPKLSPATRTVENMGRSLGPSYDMIFTGIDGSAMRFQFREYSGLDFTRPMITQDLTYPLTSKSIRFRDLALDISAVTAEKIDFTVTADAPAPGTAPAIAPNPSLTPTAPPPPVAVVRPAPPAPVYVPPPVYVAPVPVAPRPTVTPKN